MNLETAVEADAHGLVISWSVRGEGEDGPDYRPSDETALCNAGRQAPSDSHVKGLTSKELGLVGREDTSEL